VPNTRQAHEIGLHADAKGLNDVYHQTTLKACFAKGRNIGVAEVLADIGEEVGIARNKILEALQVCLSYRYKRQWVILHSLLRT
jgi:predicted DsbA family dithiol-disulfide isomerase